MSAQGLPPPDFSWMDGRTAVQWVCAATGVLSLDEALVHIAAKGFA